MLSVGSCGGAWQHPGQVCAESKTGCPLAGIALHQGTFTTTRRFGCLPTLTRIASCRFALSMIETSSLSTLLTQHQRPSGLKVTQFGPFPTPTLPTNFPFAVS